jgi:hypothetical protein
MKMWEIIKMRCVTTAITLIAITSMQFGFAQQTAPKTQTPAEVLRATQQGSDDIEQLRAGLQSPNPSVRVATFNAMIQSDNSSLVTIAINDAHGSADSTLRDLSARAAFRQVIILNLQPNEELGAKEKEYSRFAPFLGLKILQYDPSNGLFKTTYGEGQISGDHLTFRSDLCQGTLTATEGTWTYEGPVNCVQGSADQFRARMNTNIR